MAIITVSRGSYCKGSRIAESVAERLGYECVSREILLEASEEFHIPEVRLAEALHDAPSILERFVHGRQRYVTFIRTAFLEHMLRDDVVYHGLAGHFFLTGVSHVLKVRVVADLEDRVRLEMKRKGVSEHKARHDLVKDDHERRKWSRSMYGVDTADPTLYDLTVNIHRLSVDDAVEMICHAAALPHFRTTPESRAAIEDLALAARAKSAIVKQWPDAEVSAAGGLVVVHTEGPLASERQLRGKIAALIRPLPGVEEVRVDVRPTTLNP